jgi:hypothetical protein
MRSARAHLLLIFILIYEMNDLVSRNGTKFRERIIQQFTLRKLSYQSKKSLPRSTTEGIAQFRVNQKS